MTAPGLPAPGANGGGNQNEPPGAAHSPGCTRPTDFAAAVANIMALPLTDAEKAEWCILRLLAANEAGAEGRAAR